jgi:hypothetical protein
LRRRSDKAATSDSSATIDRSIERFPTLTANAHLAIDQRLMREQTGIAAPGELAVMDHQRNLGAQLQPRQLRAHAQRKRRAAHRAALFCLSDASHDKVLDSLYPSRRHVAIGYTGAEIIILLSVGAIWSRRTRQTHSWLMQCVQFFYYIG